MDVLEVSAKTVDEAVEKALQEMDASRDEVKITVLSEGKSGGIFGFGAEDARVRVERITDAPAVPTADMTAVSAETLQKLLQLLEIDGTVETASYPDESAERPTAPIAFNITGDDLGILIGRRGQTLSALQYMLRLIVGHQTKTWVPIVVDAEGYKARRHDALKELALRMADHVKTRGAPFTLEPMPAYERRVVHITLADNPAVYTESIGEGESRKVVIHPKNPSPTPRGGLQGPPDHTGSMRGGFGGRRNYPQGGQQGGGYQPRKQQPY
ncbi:MAG: RNA-binding cell elongation regulator Jag/EloR [Dehalococcoidia bacterium]|nr:RNA-binding cell elongation regulator Jag/EloR [Dehalococcoidia bacterium]